MYQQITIIGNVGRDPEMRYTQGGVAVCDFSVAVNKQYKTAAGDLRDETTWFRVTCWRELAETMAKYLTKGKQVMVVGEIHGSAYVDKSGMAAATLEITADKVKFLGQREFDYKPAAPPPSAPGKKSTQPTPNPEDIPF